MLVVKIVIGGLLTFFRACTISLTSTWLFCFIYISGLSNNRMRWFSLTIEWSISWDFGKQTLTFRYMSYFKTCEPLKARNFSNLGFQRLAYMCHNITIDTHVLSKVFYSSRKLTRSTFAVWQLQHISSNRFLHGTYHINWSIDDEFFIQLKVWFWIMTVHVLL